MGHQRHSVVADGKDLDCVVALVVPDVLDIREVEDEDSRVRVDVCGATVRALITLDLGLDAGSEVVVQTRLCGRHAHSTLDHSIQNNPLSGQLDRCDM
jgi:hypothetical protein